MAEKSSENTGSSGELSSLPPNAPPANHGRTIAAWTTTTVVVIGGRVLAVAVVMATSWLFVTGIGVVLIGLVVGKVLQILGYGQSGAATLERRSGAH